jgi:hypothetical protein
MEQAVFPILRGKRKHDAHLNSVMANLYKNAILKAEREQRGPKYNNTRGKKRNAKAASSHDGGVGIGECYKSYCRSLANILNLRRGEGGPNNGRGGDVLACKHLRMGDGVARRGPTRL